MITWIRLPAWIIGFAALTGCYAGIDDAGQAPEGDAWSKPLPSEPPSAQPTDDADPAAPQPGELPGEMGELNPSSPAEPTDPEGPAVAPGSVCKGNLSQGAGPRLLRRLTTREYETSVRTIFGLDEQQWAGPQLPPDPAALSGFTNQQDRLVVTASIAQALADESQRIADRLVEPGTLGAWLPCASSPGDACAQEYLETTGRRLFRRPLSAQERERYLALQDHVTSFDRWVWWTTRTMLQSPHFLYRSELGEPEGDIYRLTPHELATALAFTFTAAPPTDAVLDQADAGGMQTADEVVTLAEAMVAEAPEGLRDGLHRFHQQWLGLTGFNNLDKDPERFPGFGPDVRDAMTQELDAFLDEVVFEQRGGVDVLLTLEHSRIDATLANYYGYQAVPDGPTAKPEGRGVGILSLGAVLSTHATYRATSPTKRGKVIRTKFLCTEPPPPPPNVGELEPAEAFNTTRERYEEHSTNPSCAGCHRLMDPLGFGLEHLDAAGRYRADENGHAIDASGSLLDRGQRVPFEGAEALAHALAESETVSRCVAEQMGSFAFALAHDDVTCLVESAAQASVAGQSLLDTYVTLASTRHFRERR